MGLYEQKHCQFELKGTEMGQNEGKLLDFLDIMEWDHRVIQLGTCTILQDKGRMTPKEIQRPSGLPLQFQAGCGGTLPWFQTAVAQILRGRSLGDGATQILGGKTPTPQSCGGRTTGPVGRKAEHQTKEDYA